METITHGFVQRNAYFTAAEIQDPAYERRFRSNHPERCERGERFVLRNIRWYQPQRPGAERCAAIIHVAVCRGQKLDQIETARVRAEMVALEPESAIAPHCGSRAYEHDFMPYRADRGASQIVPVANLSCAVADITPALPLHVWRSTRFGVRTLIDPRLMTSSKTGHFDFVWRAPETILGPAAYRAGELASQFMMSGLVPDQGTNIVVEQRIAVSPSGEGYCISLTARQSGRLWRRGYVRDLGTSPIALTPGWRYASPVLRDAHALAQALRDALVTTPFTLDQ